jgi:membrane protease YdiL (CAAX protease family)
VTAEELVFRGYLAQAFGRVWGPSAAWWIPGALFGLLHGFNPEVGAYGLALMLPVYIGMGLILGWVTLRTGGLEAALGMHLANNLYGTLFVTAPVSALPAPALFRIQTYDAAVSLIAFLGSALLYVTFMTFILRRRSDAV